jgi:hypothetical protein
MFQVSCRYAIQAGRAEPRRNCWVREAKQVDGDEEQLVQCAAGEENCLLKVSATPYNMASSEIRLGTVPY